MEIKEELEELEEEVRDCERNLKDSEREIINVKEWNERNKVYYAEAIIRLSNFKKKNNL